MAAWQVRRESEKGKVGCDCGCGLIIDTGRAAWLATEQSRVEQSKVKRRHVICSCLSPLLSSPEMNR